MASVVEREDEEPRGVRRSRVTPNGQRLCYVLKVIQQPQRARACGSGAKSSADRRPVDPPPVVQLRIYDVKGDPEGRESEIGPDITFSYNANFFLFATLEPTRPLAHARGQPAASTQPPVLTGMPVSGMAYLDRPKEAGYFIFPDLSVRHEGKYHLSFNLYEQQKPETEGDFGGDSSEDSKQTIQVPSHMSGGSPDSCFDFRMEAKSDPFVVYSAKKFPGLHESTNLSRTVAEQGCRVRIRRDVRMRRRPDKDERPFEDRGDSQPREFSLPVHVDYNGERSRSSSRDEDGVSSPYGVEHAPRGGNLDFLGTSQPQFAHPPLPPAPSQYQQIPTNFHQGQPHYQQHQVPPPAPYRQQLPERMPERQAYAQSAHPSNPPREHDFEPYRRASDTGYGSAHSAPFPSVDMSYRRAAAYGNYPRPHSPIARSPSSTLPPLKGIERGMEPMRYEAAPPPSRDMSMYRHAGPPVPSPSYERSGGHFAYPHSSIINSPEMSRKRPFEGAFHQRRNEPLRHGGRPTSPEYEREGDEEETAAEVAMRYKRADGIVTQKSLPPPSVFQ